MPIDDKEVIEALLAAVRGVEAEGAVESEQARDLERAVQSMSLGLVMKDQRRTLRGMRKFVAALSRQK